ncbi:MAG: phosphatase PAP2 family protein [Halarcobacter sp.]
MHKSNIFQLSITIVLLLITLAIFQFTQLDIYVQEFFYDFESKSWLIDKKEPILKLFLYDTVKVSLIIFAVCILISLIFFRKKRLIQEYKKGLLVVLLSAIFVPLSIGALKKYTNTPCPCNIQHFNGSYPDIKVFDSYPKDFVQKSKARCWPAGHASAGFALMSLFFLFKKDKNKKIALIAAITLGWITGIYKMVLGDHFLSHTIITMLLSWIIIISINNLVNKSKKDNFEKPTQI